MSSNKADVTIYGQNYTISGELSEDQIVAIATYVDNKMREINDAGVTFTDMRLAVLSAVNIGQEYFSALSEVEETKKKLETAVSEAEVIREKMNRLKDEFDKYKQDGLDVIRLKDDFQDRLSAKEHEVELIKTKAREEIAKAKASSGNDKVAELEAKCEELENNFFNIQMENIQLKKQLSAYQKQFTSTIKE